MNWSLPILLLHSTAMAIDWLGFGYAAAIVLGGFMGYKKKGRSF
jgi:hypothetical protein